MVLLLKWFRDDHNSRQDLRSAVRHDDGSPIARAKDLQQTNIEIATVGSGEDLHTGHFENVWGWIAKAMWKCCEEALNY